VAELTIVSLGTLGVESTKVAPSMVKVASDTVVSKTAAVIGLSSEPKFVVKEGRQLRVKSFGKHDRNLFSEEVVKSTAENL